MRIAHHAVCAALLLGGCADAVMPDDAALHEDAVSPPPRVQHPCRQMPDHAACLARTGCDWRYTTCAQGREPRTEGCFPLEPCRRDQDCGPTEVCVSRELYSARDRGEICPPASFYCITP